MWSDKKISIVIIFVFIIIAPFCTAGTESTEPNAAELVRAVRESEMWMYDFNSLYILAEPKWGKTPESIAQRRREIIEEFNVSDPNEKQFSDLRAAHKNTLEYAVDRTRVRYMTDDPGYWRQLKIWDGNELKIHEKYYNHPQEVYVLNNKIEERMFHELFASHFGWPRSQPHSFWWNLKNVDELMDFYGRPEDFKFIGKELFREIPCYVLEHDASENLTFRWSVGQADHLLHGIQTRRGDFVSIEHWMLNYREVVPGGWFPMKTGWSFYERNPSGQQYLGSTCNIDVNEFRLNETLADELFNITFKEGIEIQDWRSGQFVSYIYKAPLVGKVIPSMEGINLDYGLAQTQSKSLLFCFFDYQQRPSRHCITQLKNQAKELMEKNVKVVLIHASKIEQEKLDEWINENNISFSVGMIEADPSTSLGTGEEETRFTWGVKSLPWLILTDDAHIVTAEGFSIAEIDTKIEEKRKKQ